MEKIINHSNEIKDFTDELAAMLPPERVIRAAKDAKKMIFHLHLAELRQQMGIRKEELSTVTQTMVSKLEARNDVNISSLIEYLDHLGLAWRLRFILKINHFHRIKKWYY